MLFEKKGVNIFALGGLLALLSKTKINLAKFISLVHVHVVQNNTPSNRQLF